ncbi:endonuclease/exonuclease/phosphatase family protein [Streptomyces sp. NPDC004609]|uniref:endonuclease/exonuclease/phosphatase family protein n=1 Tax=Streptomyces sp. NPDC004609 TaxID=3364704 RepID=UPI0036CF6B9D
MVTLALSVACLLVFPAAVPNSIGRLGSLLETFLPWLGLAVPALAALALWRRSPAGLGATLVPAVAWAVLFGGTLFARAEDSPYDLTALQHNVSDVNPDPVGTATSLLGADAELVALEELTPSALPAYRRTLGPRYPYHAVTGTVGLWSAYPLTDVRPVDIRPAGVPDGWLRGLRATAATPYGEVAVYVAHLPSVRLGVTGFGAARRDESAALLGAAIAAEPLEKVILLGDLNGTTDDRGLDPVAARLDFPESGFAFSWPARVPLARIDQVMARSATVTHIRALSGTGSDHLPVAARIRF